MRNKRSLILILFVALFCLPPSALPWSRAQDKKPDGPPPPSRKVYELRYLWPIAIRFNAETGESWRIPAALVAEVRWAKIKDSKRIPAGNYDVVLSVNKEGDKFTAFRIDCATGKTWLLDTTEQEWEWKEIAEP